jgi:arsenate reductase-like glutaredoxin family protein
LFEGNKDLEKKLEDNFEKLMKTHQRLYNKLVETNEFMQELKESLQKILLERRK